MCSFYVLLQCVILFYQRCWCGTVYVKQLILIHCVPANWAFLTWLYNCIENGWVMMASYQLYLFTYFIGDSWQNDGNSQIHLKVFCTEILVFFKVQPILLLIHRKNRNSKFKIIKYAWQMQNPGLSVAVYIFTTANFHPWCSL